jgi:hypothetical protein
MGGLGMNSQELLILASERFNSAEISAAAGLCYERADKARTEALTLLRRQEATRKTNKRVREWMRANRKSRAIRG